MNDNIQILQDRRVSDKGLGGTVLTMQERLNRNDAQLAEMKESLEKNTTVTNEIYEIVLMGKSFFRVAGYIGVGVKWILAAGAATAAIWGAWKSH